MTILLFQLKKYLHKNSVVCAKSCRRAHLIRKLILFERPAARRTGLIVWQDAEDCVFGRQILPLSPAE
jgi:hypothetical protein